MSITGLDWSLEELSKKLDDAVNGYLPILGVFKDFVTVCNNSELLVTPEKPNSARKTYDLKLDGDDLGKLYAILFMPLDGTGDFKTYDEGSLIVPNQFQFDEKPDRIYPRAKYGIFKELFMPLFSYVPEDGTFVKNLTCLEELVINDSNEVVLGCNLGAKIPSSFDESLFSVYNLNSTIPQVEPKIQQTTGFQYGERFGDPHAVLNAVTNVVQAGAFLSIPNENRFLLTKLKQENFENPFL